MRAAASTAASPRSGSGTTATLSTAEVGAIRALQCLMHPGVLATLCCLTVLYVLGHLVSWLAGVLGPPSPGWDHHPPGQCHPPSRDPLSPAPPAQPPPTLYDPARLQTTLELFAETTAAGGEAAPPPRHRTEALCRDLLERMVGVPLPKCRPRWLVNPSTRRSLELDMYSADRRLAFEYDGAQHDHYTPHYHPSPHHFEYRRLLDRLKDDLCRETGAPVAQPPWPLSLCFVWRALRRAAGVLLLRIPWKEVSSSDEVRTARYLEGLLTAHGVPHRSLLQTEPPPPPSRPPPPARLLHLQPPVDPHGAHLLRRERGGGGASTKRPSGSGDA